MSYRSLFLALVISVLAAGCAQKPQLTPTEIASTYPDLSLLQQGLEQARSEELNLLAPAAFARAQDRLRRAEGFAVQNDPLTESLVGEGLQALENANKQGTQANDVFDEVLLARSKAQRAGAPSQNPRGFSDADARLQRAAGLLESGQRNEAVRDNARIISDFAALELAALQANAVSLAEQSIAAAVAAEGRDLAPRTLALAEEELQLALNVLAADSTAVAKADTHAERSLFHSQRALQITEIVRRFEDGDYSEEDKILWYQEQLSTVLGPLNAELPFDMPNKDLIAESRQELSAMIAALSASQAEVTNLAAEKDAIQTQALLDAEQERRRNQAIAAKFATIQALFGPEVAEVYRQGDNVLIRAHGFNFPTGTSEITSENFPVLASITQAIEQFPNSSVVISGHTDSQGGAENNLRLSEERAEKVADFLVEVRGLERSRISSTGYGAAQPVANNATAEGRAANRRVEVLILNQAELL